MKFQSVPVQTTGASYESRSRPLSSQRTVNWYQQVLDQAEETFVLLPFPGLKFFTTGQGIDRGFEKFGRFMFQVKGTRLILFTDSRSRDVGQIPGVGRCIMANDGENLFVVTESNGVFKYGNSILSEVTDPNISGANSVDFINNQFLYTFSNFTSVSNVGDGSTVNSLNIIGEETEPDALVRDFVFDEIIYRFGTRSTVAWYNSGVGNPPIEKLQGRIFQVGLAAIHSVVRTDDAMYWLGDDFRIYRASSGAKQVVSTEPLSTEFAKYSAENGTDVSDAFGQTITLGGNNFYIITFPSANKTYILNESLGKLGWAELSSGLDGGRYQGNSFVQYNGKTYVADVDNGNIYTLDIDTYTNNGEPLRRERVTGSVNGDLLGAKGKRLQMSKAKFIMETGVGLINGQGDNPKIMIEHSDDGGRSWTHGGWPRVGRLGEFTLQVEYYNLDTFFDRIFRISTTDPVNYSIYSATIDVRKASDL